MKVTNSIKYTFVILNDLRELESMSLCLCLTHAPHIHLNVFSFQYTN